MRGLIGLMAALSLALCAPARAADYDASYTTFWTLTVGTATSAGRAIEINCTIAGNVSITLSTGLTLVIPVTVGLSILPFAVNEVNSSGTTATATYANLN